MGTKARSEAARVRGSGDLASAYPGKVDTGFPKRICAKKRNLEHIPIPSNRDVL
jgi:hypothetical protein